MSKLHLRSRALLLMLPGFLVAVTMSAQGKFVWQNPVRFAEAAGVYRDEVRDPCIFREDSTYYLIHTMFPFTHSDSRDSTRTDYNSSPGIRLYQSTDLKHWTVAATSIGDGWLVKSSMLPDDAPYKHRFWAPEIHKIGSKFYLVFTGSNWIRDSYNPTGNMHDLNTFIGVSDHVNGPYEHISYLPGGACDLSLLEDPASGKTYAYIPGMDVYVQEIDLSQIAADKVSLKGERTKVVTALNNDIAVNWDYKYLEGPFPMLYDNRYYLFFAGLRKDGHRSSGYDHPGEFEYWSGMAWADSATGPFRKMPAGKAFWGGHLAVFTGPGAQPWFSYRGEKHPDTRGFLCIDPVLAGGKGRDIKFTEPSHSRKSIPLGTRKR